jgi:cupin fold WbuC family metalloprotein
MIGSFRAVSPAVFESADDPVAFGDAELAELLAAAKKSPTGRCRMLLHPDRDDALHEMVIAIPPQSCDHPHINDRSGKSFCALSGQFAVVHFSDDGSEIGAVVLSAGPWPGQRMLRLRAPRWHTIIPLEGETAFLETIRGPFIGNRWAPWFPGEEDPVARTAFADRLRGLARVAAEGLRTR